MAPDEILNLIITYKKKIALYTLAFFLLIAAINVIKTYAIVDVDIDTGGNQASKLTIYTSSDVATAKAWGAGLNIVPRNTKSLIVASGDTMKTQSKISIPWFGFAYKKVALKKDKNAEKVAFKSTTSATCASYSANFDRLMYYTCRRPATVLEYQTPATGTWAAKKIADIGFYGDKAVPYMGGVIGISYRQNTDVIQPGEITAITESGQKAYYSPPEGFNLDEIGRSKLFTDTNDVTNGRFALVDRQGDIYLGTPTGGKNIDYQHIPPPEKYNPTYNQTLCTVNGDSAYCYRGHAAVGDRPEKFDTTQLADDTIVTLSFNDANTNAIKVDPSDFVLSDFYTTTTGELYGKSHKKLYAFDKTGDKYIPDELSQNIDGAASNQNMYFIQDNGIFQVDSKTKDSYQIFRSNNIMPKAVYTATDKVFVIGNIKGIESTTYAYVLTSEDNMNPDKRLIDLFPTASGSLPDTTSTDLVGDRILIGLRLTSRRSINQLDLENKKQAVFQALESRGINVVEDNIQFTY